MSSRPSASVARGTTIPRRIAQGGWSTGLYAIGVVVDCMSLANVPGTTHVADGEIAVNDFGTVLFLIELIAWVSVFWRRRMPLAPLIAGLVLAAIGMSYLLLLVGVFEALLAWPARTKRLLYVACVAIGGFSLREVLTPWGGAFTKVFSSEVGTTGRPVAEAITSITFAAVSFASVFGFLAYRRARGEADVNRSRADQEERRADALSVAVARQQERESVARDLHDTLAGSLAVISLQAGALEVTAANSSPDEVAGRAQNLQQQAHQALEQVRELLGALRTPGAEGATSVTITLKSLGPLLRRFREHGVAVEPYVLIEDADKASDQFEATVFRVVQESLTNAFKHAQGAPVSVFVEVSEASGARIRVSNPLRAFVGAAVPSPRQGTRGIRERAAALGGTAWIGEYQGAFVVDVKLPWHGRA